MGVANSGSVGRGKSFGPLVRDQLGKARNSNPTLVANDCIQRRDASVRVSLNNLAPPTPMSRPLGGLGLAANGIRSLVSVRPESSLS